MKSKINYAKPAFYDNTITPLSRLVYGYLLRVTNNDNACKVTNRELAKIYNSSIDTISRAISQLDEKGYINTRVKIDNHISSREIELV